MNGPRLTSQLLLSYMIGLKGQIRSGILKKPEQNHPYNLLILPQNRSSTQCV
ncbi:hypothetical protein MKW98_008805, partial [Papaver atlanticum]